MNRRLAAILAADIAGYSALMGADEEATVRDLKAHQAVVLPMIGEHGGRIVDTAGDGILAEFGSVLSAVKCALAIQKAMEERNADIDPVRRMQFRIGINQGDVVFDDARVYGDGVNVAARLENIADAGGICISEKVYQEVRGKIDFASRDLGSQILKNIADPVRAHQIDLGGATSAIPSQTLLNKSTVTPPDKPSIAVLAFTNMSGDPTQEYFTDGITEDIITELSRFSELFVIARNSTFQFKGKTTDIRVVGRELGVRYVLEGSIRRDGDRVRISAQLIDAITGAHRWAERYDRKLVDVFAVQDEVARTIVAMLAVHVNKVETERVLAKPPTSWQAHDYYLRAAEAYVSYHSTYSVAKLHEARRLLQSSLAIDPGYARAIAALATTYVSSWAHPRDADFLSAAALDQAYDLAREAVDLNPTLPQTHVALGAVLSFKRQHEAAIAEFERAIVINPNFTNWRFAFALVLAGEPARAVQVLKAHMRLDPFYEAYALGLLGLSYYMLKRYAEATASLRECVARAPNLLAFRVWLAQSYAQSGQLDDAKTQAAEVLRIDPTFSISPRTIIMGFRRPEDTKHFLDGASKAGLPKR